MSSIIDQYMPCVCGSGKKFKFCKCGATEHTSELEKILKLMDGDQELAALDRINGQLAKLPNAAWLYALKAEVLLRLEEHQSLIEVARRFRKLKPDNPLALINCSIASGLASDPLQEQARSLLAGIAECRETVPQVLNFAIELLAHRLLGEGNSALFGFWGLMQRSSAGSKDPILMQDPSIHWLCKAPNKIFEVPDGAPWQERMDEVNALSTAFRFEQVEKKLQSILREFPNQPAPLSALLSAQIAQLDQDGATATAKKLAEHKDISTDDRAMFQVLAWELQKTPLAINDFKLFGEIDSDEQLIEECTSMSELLADEDEELRYLTASAIGEEVPAKRVYRLRFSQTQDGIEQQEEAGTLAIFGRQTDKPPRVFFMAVNFPAYQPLRDKVVSRLNIVQQLDAPTINSRKYTEILGRPISVMHGNRNWETSDERGRRLVEEFLSFPFAVLDGLTPLEAAKNQEMRDKLTALVIHLEGTPNLLVPQSALVKIYERLQLHRPQRTAKTQLEGMLVLNDLLDALWLDYDQLPLNHLVQLFNTVQTYGMFRLMLELASRLVANPQAMQDEVMEFKVRSALFSLISEPDIRLTHSQRLIELRKLLKQPIGQTVLTHSALLSSLGREEEARAFLTKAMQENQEDPELMMFAHQMYSRAAGRQQGEDESMLGGGASGGTGPLGKQPASGLVLPGSGDSTTTESKLWIPGT